MSRMEITCIGQALVDCITRRMGEEDPSKRVHRAKSISLSIGGDAVNEATVLARLGHRVRLVCGLGQDPAGDLILDHVRRNGIDGSLIDRKAGRPTPLANLLVNEDGSRVSFNDASSLLEDYIPPVLSCDGTRIVSLASLFRAPLDRRDTLLRLVKTAKENGCLVCADTKLPTFRNIGLSDIADILPMIDYIFPNDAEAAWLTGCGDYADMSARLRDAGVKNVIIKAGSDGCYVYGREGHFHMEALPVKAVDATGAGDNFVAGFLSGLLRGFSLYDCCSYGSICAAVCVQNIGAGGGVRSREEADELAARKARLCSSHE